MVVGSPNTVQSCLPTSCFRLRNQVVLMKSAKQLQKEEKLNLIAIIKKIIYVKLWKTVAVGGRERKRRELTYTEMAAKISQEAKDLLNSHLVRNWWRQTEGLLKVLLYSEWPWKTKYWCKEKPISVLQSWKFTNIHKMQYRLKLYKACTKFLLGWRTTWIDFYPNCRTIKCP